MNELLTNQLSLSYGDQLIIEQLNLHIPKGKITILVGSNGCGKSTLL
ncbi:MAG: ATP-binding cassette domain-containing protein, partial [Paenibacillaceae bacterium]|nr:ATP-binding cassette domain-containing protein [Paenibacillaceae bacterium]